MFVFFVQLFKALQFQLLLLFEMKGNDISENNTQITTRFKTKKEAKYLRLAKSSGSFNPIYSSFF